ALDPAKEHIVPRRVRVVIARRHGDRLHAQSHREIEELRDFVRILVGKERAVDGDAKAALAQQLDRGDRLVEHPFLAHRRIVLALHAVQVDRKSQVRRRLVFIDVLGYQQRVGAQIDEFLARDDALDDLRQALVDQRLAARDRHPRGAAIVDRLQRIGDAHAALQYVLLIVDLAAAGAGQIALEQWLEHQHQRIALAAADLLLQQILTDSVLLYEGDTHRIIWTDKPHLRTRWHFGLRRLSDQDRRHDTMIHDWAPGIGRLPAERLTMQGSLAA